MKSAWYEPIYWIAWMRSCADTVATTSTASDSQEVFVSQIVERTLVHESGIEVVNKRNGQIVGTEADGSPIQGAWAIQEGQYCRTIVLPEEFAGTQCQILDIVGDQLTIARPDGSTITYTIS